MARRPAITRLLGAVSVLILLPLATNVAAGILPTSWRPYFWLSWPIIVVCFWIALGFRFRDSTPPGVDSPASTVIDWPQRKNSAVALLAAAIRTQWNDEATMQGLNQPIPIRLRWSSTKRPIASGPLPATDGIATAQRQVKDAIRGDVDNIAPVFRGLSTKRMVIVGPPGSGKTVLAMLLTLRLLDDRAPEEAVPLLLSVASWDPSAEHIHTWLARKLEEDYEFLKHRATFGQGAALSLIRDAAVIPVLDGLDEMPELLRVGAIEAIDRYHGKRPIVITCRLPEYEEAVAAGDHVLSGAAVVEIEPVDPHDAVDFLTSGMVLRSPRWQPLLDHLLADQATPTTVALSTPFLVSLVRYVFEDQRRDPRELLDLRRYSTPEKIEQYLLSAFVDAAYIAPRWPTERLDRRHKVYRPAVARKWLTFLASHLKWIQTPDLTLWELRRAVHPSELEFATRLILSIVAGAVFGVSFAVAFGIDGAAWGVGIGLAISILVAVILSLMDVNRPGINGSRGVTPQRLMASVLEAATGGAWLP